MASKLAAAQARLKNWRKKGQEKLETVVGAAAGGVTSVALGYGRGRLSEPTAGTDAPKDEFAVAGVPAEVITAVVGHGLGLSGVAGRSSYILHAVGQAGVDCYGYFAGVDMGQRARAEAGEVATGSVAAARGRV
jgi:hypothetical protein